MEIYFPIRNKIFDIIRTEIKSFLNKNLTFTMENIKDKPYLIHTVMVRRVKHMYVALLKSPKTRQHGMTTIMG